MPAVTVQISRFVDDHQPGFVECILMDALGKSHLFVEKAPIVSTDDLWSTSNYPQPGAIACEVAEQWQDEAGRSLVRVSTERPWGVESTAGTTCFTVLLAQLVLGDGPA
jgi:hypothetical protein